MRATVVSCIAELTLRILNGYRHSDARIVRFLPENGEVMHSGLSPEFSPIRDTRQVSVRRRKRRVSLLSGLLHSECIGVSLGSREGGMQTAGEIILIRLVAVRALNAQFHGGLSS